MMVVFMGASPWNVCSCRFIIRFHGMQLPCHPGENGFSPAESRFSLQPASINAQSLRSTAQSLRKTGH